MDSENDNDQPNSSSASASSSSSSNNSSSSNLLGHLPMLPFMRSTDDDEQEADGDGEADGNDINEEPMPLQPHVTVAMAASASASAQQSASALVQQPTLAPITTTSSSSTAMTTTSSAAAGAAANDNAASTSAGREEEPMVGAEQLAVLTTSSSSSSSASSLPPSSSFTSASSVTTTTSFAILPPSAFLPSANPSQVIFSPCLFNNLPSTSSSSSVSIPLNANSNLNSNNDFNPSLGLTSPNPALSVQVFSSASSQIMNNTISLTISSPSSSAASSVTTSSLSSSTTTTTTSSSSSTTQSFHDIHPNLAQSHHQQLQQLSLLHEQNPIPSTSFSLSSPQQQQQPQPEQHQVSPAPQAQPQPQQIQESSIESASSSTSSSATLQQQLAAGQSQQERGEQQLTAQINRNDIADTIDASAVIVQPLVEANAEHQQHPHLYPQEAANSGEEVEVEQRPNDIQLDDNDNNDFDVDLNLRNDDALANASTTNQQQEPQQQQQQSIPLDTSASGSAGPSSSGLQQQQQTPQPPTTLPLLLQQQQQQQHQQQTEESKHLPSYDHHYHNPREFHLHAHPYQHPCVYPYGYRASSPTHNQQQQQTNGATLNSSNNNIMFGTTMSSDRNHGSSTSAGLGSGGIASSPSNQVVDRLKLLYPNVNENETPLPRCWSPHDKCLSIGLSQNNLRVHFKGKQSNDAASVRTAHPIPPACGIYYFEVKIISKGKNGYMGIGLTAQQFRMNRLPGWDKQSYGYHGDDGNSFSSSGHGQSYGPTFTTGDIIGCCVNFVENTCFYTKNGIDLGIAFRDLPTKLYPTVGLQTPGEEVDANFGQEPFKFDQIEDMMKQMRGEIKAAIYDFPLRAEQGDPTTLLQKMVNSYLVHNGYSQTAEAFARQKTGQSQREDITSIRNRQKILKLVMSGKMGQAIEQTMRLYPGLLENNKNLWFMLKCRQFIEMINGSDIEYCPSSSTTSSTANKTTNTNNTIQTTTSAPNQTSVIQSTKSYQNGNGANNSSNGSGTTDASTSTTTSASIAAVDADADATTAATTNTTNNSCSNTQTQTATINNAQNSSHITVINADHDLIKLQSHSAEHCSILNVSPTTISKSNNDNDYLNDVEMENNGHTANGNVCKNGNSNNFNDSIDADEDMDVDVLPSVRKYSHGIERILEFGKDLSQMGQQLEKENKMTDEERQMLEDAFSLIAYSNPWASPLGWQLCPTKRETVCRALNSAILESMNFSKWPPLEYCVAHANELLKVMAQASIGACAFVNIADVFPKN